MKKLEVIRGLKNIPDLKFFDFPGASSDEGSDPDLSHLPTVHFQFNDLRGHHPFKWANGNGTMGNVDFLFRNSKRSKQPGRAIWLCGTEASTQVIWNGQIHGATFDFVGHMMRNTKAQCRSTHTRTGKAGMEVWTPHPTPTTIFGHEFWIMILNANNNHQAALLLTHWFKPKERCLIGFDSFGPWP